MSYTLKISDGDIDIGASTGKFNTVQDFEKLCQDTGESLLITYDAERDYGNELIDFDLVPSSSIASGTISRMVSNAITRMQSIQQSQNNLSYGEKMSHIGQLVVVPDKNGDIYFYVSVVSADGQAVEKILNAGKSIPITRLNQSLPAAITENIIWK